MTTVIRTRNPLETLNMSQQPASRRRSKRLAGPEEEDGDFHFTRVSKRKKTAPAAPEPAEAAPAAISSPKVVSRRTKKQDADGEHGEKPAKKARGRPMNFTTPKAEVESVHVAKRGTRKSTRLSTEYPSHGGLQGGKPTMDVSASEIIDVVGAVGADKIQGTPADSSKQSTTIALPFSDTPVINRNKELRKKGAGARRSSLGMRGRRASSLIENGHSAIPHREVETSDFYKHIEEGLPEPRRMKQLLTWTGERALPEKPALGDADSAAKLAARAISEALLKDFGAKSEFSNWFDREESAPLQKPMRIIKKPNPRNLDIEQSIAELEPRIKRLQEERDQWKALKRLPPSLPPLLSPDSAELLSPSQIDESLLDPEQASILASLASSSASELHSQVYERLKSIQDKIEFKIDHFADGIHKIEQYQETAGRVADKILNMSAVRLEEREKKEKEEIGTRDVPMQEVLRSLSRILPAEEGSR